MHFLIRGDFMLIIATNNEHKVKEFERILAPLGIEVMSQSKYGVNLTVEETETTFEGNAKLKAVALFNATGKMSVADDSGLQVYALNNEPGVYSARYGGELCKNSVDQYNLVLKKMEGVPPHERGARFVCAICLVMEDASVHNFIGICEGEIGEVPQGENGFGYDPVFIVNGESFAELDGVKKDNCSHRGAALRQLANFLEKKECLK